MNAVVRVSLATVVVAASIVALTAWLLTARLHAQGWSADVSAGRTVYDPVAATVHTNSLVGTVRHDSRRATWIYGAVAPPAGETSTFWTAAGVGQRLARALRGGRSSVGVDVGAHGFWFRDRVVDLAGTGGTVEVQPSVRVGLGGAFVEANAAVRGHTLSYASGRASRGVFETGLRGGVGYEAGVLIEGAVRWVRAAEGTFPLVAALVSYERARGSLWAQTGKWLDAEVTDHMWGFGGAVTIREGTSLWAAIQREGPDPLYWNLARRTWSIGLTQRIGRPPVRVLPLPVSQNGVVVVRVPAADAPDGAVAIAGDFNNWQPAAMERDGGDWVARLSLGPGVYHYAFRSASGDWFVPASTAGRRDDGFGGYQAVLVVD